MQVQLLYGRKLWHLTIFPYVDICVYTSSMDSLFLHKMDSQARLTCGLHDCGLWVVWKGTSELYKPRTVYNIRCNNSISLSYWETRLYLTNCFRYYSSDCQCTQSVLLKLCFRALLRDVCFRRAALQRLQNNLGRKGTRELPSLSSCCEQDQLRGQQQAVQALLHPGIAFSYVQWEPVLFQFLCIFLPLCAAGSSLAFSLWWPPHRWWWGCC